MPQLLNLLAACAQWRMTGSPEPPASPPTPGVSTREISMLLLASVVTYLTMIFLGAFIPLIQPQLAPRGFSPTSTSTPNLRNNHHIFSFSTPSSRHLPPHTHNASSTIRRPRPFAPHRPFARARCADFPAADPACDFIRRARHPDPPPAGTYLPRPRLVRPDGFHSCVRLTSELAIIFLIYIHEKRRDRAIRSWFGPAEMAERHVCLSK